MPNTTPIFQLKAAVASCGSLLARIYGADGEVVTKASFSGVSNAITTYVRQMDKTGSVSTTNPSYNDAVFDSLQTDGRWSKDTLGYNFRWDYDETVFPSHGRYGVTIRFEDVDGNVFNGVEAEVTVEKSRAS